MHRNFVKEKLKAGKTVTGTWSIINSPIVSEIVAASGFDFQILDLEHGVFDIGTLDSSIRASEAHGCSPLVRVAGLQPTAIQSCLDLGAHGIVVPQVQSHTAAQQAVQAMKFAPKGTRGLNPFTRAGNYAGAVDATAPKLANDFGLSAVIIENKEAYQDLDRILALPDLDLVYLGVYDMSVALGCPGQVDAPEVSRFVEACVPKIRAAGKAAGLMTKAADARRFQDLGANFVVVGVDTQIILCAMKDRAAIVAKA